MRKLFLVLVSVVGTYGCFVSIRVSGMLLHLNG